MFMYIHAGITLVGNIFWIDYQLNDRKVSPDNTNFVIYFMSPALPVINLSV